MKLFPWFFTSLFTSLLLVGASLLPNTAQAANPFCFNFGQETGRSYDLSAGGKMDRYLTILKDGEVTCLRLAFMGQNNDESEALALYAQARGFRIIIGNDDDGNGLSPDKLSAYDSGVIAEAIWAEANGIAQLSIGNEQDGRLDNMSQAEWAAHVRELAHAVKQVYHGVVSYDISGELDDVWATESIGELDLIGINLYCGGDCNRSKVQKLIDAFGREHVYISETNADIGYFPEYADDEKHAAALIDDIVSLLDLGIPIYYFTFDADGGNGIKATWGIYSDGVLQKKKVAFVLRLTDK